MNAFCPNLSNKKVKQEFDELTSLFGEDAAYFLWDKNNGYSLDKAPNGADSILFKSLLDNYNGDRQAALKAKAKVYTSNFINWFGDWIKEDKVEPNTEASKRLISYVTEISNRNNRFSKLAKLLLNNKALPYNLKYFKIDNNRNDIEGAAGMWHSLVNYIEVLGNNVSQESIDKHLLHELIHYNTEQLLQDYKDNKLVDNVKKEAIKSLYDIIAYAKDFISKDLQVNRNKYIEIARRQNNTIDSRVFYAFDNQGDVEIDEFISEIFTNPGFQEILNNIPYKESKQTIWYKIKEVISSIFGFNINKGSVLEEALKASSNLLQNNNVSKVVDENGEPLVVYHYTDNEGLTKFSTEFDNYFSKAGGTKKAIFFTTDNVVPGSEDNFLTSRKTKLSLFLNIKNLEIFNGTKDDLHKQGTSYREVVNKSSEREGSENGIVFTGFDDNKKENQTIYIVHNSNQIKSATDNKGTYSTQNDNIYESKQDIISQQEREQIYNFIEDKKKRYLSTGYYKMDKSRREIIKDNIRKEFESKFSHFRLKFLYDEKRDRLIMYTEPKTKKDVAQWQSIIFGKQNANSPFSQSDTEAVMREILKEVRGTSIHERFIADAIAKALKGKHISFEFTTSLPLDTAARYDAYRHVVQINSYATFRNDNNYSNSLTQTIMHELLHAVTVETINGNEELKSKLENLLSEVKKALGEDAKDYGLSDIYEFLAELSNINFVHKLQQIKVDKKDTTFFQRVRSFVNEVIRKIALSIGVHKNTAYEDAMDLLMQSMFPQDFKLKIVYQENAPTLFDSTAQQNEIKSKIQKQFSILYKAYKKLPNKSAKREQIQNKIFETINELQLQDDQLAINTALNMAIQNIGIVDNLSGNAAKNTVLGFLQQQSQLQDPYSNITADELVLMYQNSIAFYSNLVKNEIPSVNDKNMTSNNRALKKEVEASIDSAYNLWKEALVVVTDKIVDDIVDNEVITSEDSTKDDMKQVLKDYLHRNAMYGDINTWYEYTSNNARSQSPLIKAAFNLIQYAETKTLEESYKERSKIVNAYEKANKISKQLTRNWQKQFMEFDRNGVPTGYFIRPINYGQYLLDVDAEVERINQDFQNRYGFHYITDDVTGKLINSVTKQFADDEEWEDGKMPHIVEYQLALYDFKCTHANLRYTYDYYKERLSQPYRGSLDPDDVEAKQLSECHGLSPKTLAKYNLIQSNINYYLNKCKDKETGFSYPERLTDPEDQRKLDMWNHQLEQLSNAYNEDGTIKTDEDRQIAFELKAWQKWIGSQINSDIDYDSYVSERKKIEEECNKTGDFTPLQLFVKYNATIGINPNLINMIFKDAEDINPESHDVIYARLIRGMLKSAVKGDGLEPDLRRMMNNIQFWIDCKNTDQIIEDGGEHNTETHDFSDYFYMHPIPYRDEQGYYLNEDLEQTVNEDEAISFYQYMVDHYTQIAQNDGYIPGLNDDEGNPIDFSQQSENDIRTFFKDLFTYTYLEQDFETGLMTESRKPLSIFSYLEPLNKVFNNKYGKTEFSIIEIPRGRFLQKSNPKYINEQYDIYQNQSEQPNPFYYDNSEAYDKMMSDNTMRTLYEQLIQSMQQSQQWMEFNNQQFNYQLPKLQASDVVSILRSTKKGTKSALDNIREQFLNVNTNDYDQRSTDDLYLGPDQTVNQNIPLKFIGKLKDREKYTYDITSAVLMYVNMASNYKNKRNILTKLQALRYAQDPENREETVNDTKNLRSQYDSMMDSHVYGNLYKNSRTRIIAGTIKRLSTLQMLRY